MAENYLVTRYYALKHRRAETDPAGVRMTEHIIGQIAALPSNVDRVRLALESGEIITASVHAITAARAERTPRRLGPGRIDIGLEATSEADHAHDLPSETLMVYAKEPRPGHFDGVDLDVWIPEVEDDEGHSTGGRWKTLGTITDIQMADDDE